MMFQLSSDLHRRQFMASNASALALTMVSQSTLLALGNDVQTMTLGFSTYGSWNNNRGGDSVIGKDRLRRS